MKPENGPPADASPLGLSLSLATRLVCHGCGHRVPIGTPHPFSCPNAKAEDDVDHALGRVFDADAFHAWGDPRTIFADREPNPFRRYRTLLYSYQVAKAVGLPDSAYLRLVDRLDRAIGEVDGHGFAATPLTRQAGLARRVGLEPDRLWVKDETGNVAGSHKARHLMGIMIWLEIARRLEAAGELEPRLAIASCGNAAVAAGVLARAAGRPLDVFVPPDARPRTLARLEELEAHLEVCPRREGDPPGDPCFHRFNEARERGSLPFGVQGPRNGLAIEGGCTLVWEMISTLLAEGETLDHLFVQVGGGALASACVAGLREARALGLIERLPRIHTVQTTGAWPLRRAWRRMAAELLGLEIGEDPIPVEAENRWAVEIRDQIDGERLCAALDHGARHRSDYMWPWETEPRSIAYGILDDETYDWLAVAGGMLETGGVPLVVSEEFLAEAHRLGRENTGIHVEPTGTAGLAGLLAASRAGMLDPHESAAVLFTGIER